MISRCVHTQCRWDVESGNAHNVSSRMNSVILAKERPVTTATVHASDDARSWTVSRMSLLMHASSGRATIGVSVPS